MVLRQIAKELEAVKGPCKCVKLGFPIVSSNKTLPIKQNQSVRERERVLQIFLKLVLDLEKKEKRKRKTVVVGLGKAFSVYLNLCGRRSYKECLYIILHASNPDSNILREIEIFLRLGDRI